MATNAKLSGVVMLLLTLLLAGVATSAQASTIPTPFTFTFDENGAGSFLINGSTLTVTGSLVSDPSNGNIPALTYMLPAAVGLVGNGDIGVLEAGSTDLSELVRFTDSSGALTGTTADRMIYYSEVDKPAEGDLADTGFPTNASPSIFVVEKALPEGGTGFTTGNIGSSEVYIGVSDLATVPEPSSFLLLGPGLLGIVGYGRRKWLR